MTKLIEGFFTLWLYLAFAFWVFTARSCVESMAWPADVIAVAKEKLK